jgi:uncharacterized repeat protein (TIGR03803 family)
MAQSGGVYSSGVIFSLDTAGSNYRNLYNFNDTNGDHPEGALILSGSVLYGMAYNGGSGNGGTIFSTDTNGNRFKVLHNFTFISGANPYGDLTLSKGVLYGMADAGGTGDSGVVFSIDTNGNMYHDMFNFNSNNGGLPRGDITLSGDTLYGMTSAGGGYNSGVIFRIYFTTDGMVNLTAIPGSVNLYPNPNNGVFSIQMKNEEGRMKSIEIYNTLGQQVYFQFSAFPKGIHSDNSSLSINLSSQPSGVYLYRIVSESGELIAEGKFVKQ